MARPYPPRLEIRNRILDRLRNRTAAQDRIRVNVTKRQLERMVENGPVIRVYLFQETGEQDGAEAHSYKRVLEVAVHLTAVSDEDVDEVLELLAFDVEALLFTDPLLNDEPIVEDGKTVEAFASSFEFSRMTLAPDEDTGFGHHVSIYQATYYTDQPEAGSLDSFITADIETHVADGTPTTPPAHDRLTLPQ